MRERNSIRGKGNTTLVLTALVVGAALVAACANSQAKDEAMNASNSQPTALADSG